MAEQSKKSYISAREFIDSWEKEIYELTQLDFFVFLLINELASDLESRHFSKFSAQDTLFLNSEEIGALSFNIGDATQLFFEKNCFGSCTLHCPAQPNALIQPEEVILKEDDFPTGQFSAKSCNTKDECLQADLLNYVVLDSLLDFYNYELGVILKEDDGKLLETAEFILETIMNAVRREGAKWLQNAGESASEHFERLLQNEEYHWDNQFAPNADENIEGDEWKEKISSPLTVLETFEQEQEAIPEQKLRHHILTKFGEYLSDFLELPTIDEMTFEDIEEFFCIILVNELAMEENPDLYFAVTTFKKLIDYLTYNFDLSFQAAFERFEQVVVPQLQRGFNIAYQYQREHPLVEYLLSGEKENDTLVEGFFTVEQILGEAGVLEDMHLKSHYPAVDLGQLNTAVLNIGDILHAQLALTDNLWRLVHLEMVYPQQATPYLL